MEGNISHAYEEPTESQQSDVLIVELQTHLSEMIGREVDLGEPEALKPLIRGRVLKEVIWI